LAKKILKTVPKKKILPKKVPVKKPIKPLKKPIKPLKKPIIKPVVKKPVVVKPKIEEPLPAMVDLPAPVAVD
jgi:hypothetical protein